MSNASGPGSPPRDEESRLRAPAEQASAGSSLDADLDRLLGLAARVADAPVALMKLAGRERHHATVTFGAGLRETLRDGSFRAHVLAGRSVLVVLDATMDSRFSANPSVVGDPHIRFYAGAPLVSTEGPVVGTLGVIDFRPRAAFAENDRKALEDIAASIMQRIDLHERLRLDGEARSRFWNIASTTSDAILCSDGLGRITFLNPQAERLFGCSARNMRGQRLTDLIPAVESIEEGASAAEHVCRRHDGEEFLLGISVARWIEDGRPCLGVIGRSVARRKDRKREHQFRVLVDGVIDYAICMLDPSGIVTNWNSGAQSLEGYTADEIVGSHFSRFYDKEDRDAGVPARDLEIAGREGRFETEGWRVRKDGSRFWAATVIDPIRDEDGTFLGFAKITHDISKKRRAEEALRESERQLRLLVSSVRDHALYMLDPNGIITSWNAGAQRIKGYTADEIIGKHFSIFYTEEERAAGAPGRSLRIATEQRRFEAEALRVRKDGSTFWANVVIESIYDEGGTLVGFAKITRDMTEHRRNREHLHRLAHVDTLTEVPNRIALQTRLKEILDARKPVTVLLLDLDAFKDVNNTLGHTVGDHILRAAAKRIQALVGNGGMVGRVGGDEFAVIIAGNADPAVAAATCRRLIDAFRTPFVCEEQESFLGLSIGISIGPDHGTSADELLANADVALYRAKEERQLGYCLFQPSFRNAVIAKRQCEQELRQAVLRGELELFYQPQVTLDDRCIFGAEGLLRWRHPQRGLIPPGLFLHVLERMPLAAEVGDWSIRTACTYARAVRDSGLEGFRVSVNLFGGQFRTDRLTSTVAKALDDNGLSPDAIGLEITENIILQHDEAMLGPLRELRKLGVGIAFDDYGTGYASLSLLKRFPLSELKIDQTFIRDICSDSEDAAVVRAIMDLGKGFGLDVIAEGIETEEQAAAVRSIGCTRGQGYLYGRPVPAREMLELVAGQVRGGGCTARTPMRPASILVLRP